MPGPVMIDLDDAQIRNFLGNVLARSKDADVIILAYVCLALFARIDELETDFAELFTGAHPVLGMAAILRGRV